MNVARAMGNTLDQQYVPDLIRAFNENNDERVRGIIAWALGRIGGEKAKTALENLPLDGDGIVHREIKSALEKEQFIHRVQFEKEFEIYLGLWKKLFDLKEATEMLIPVVDYNEPGKNEEQTKKIRLKRVEKAYGEVRTAINHNKPFFAEDVYKHANKILRESFRQALASQYPGKHVEEFLERFGKAQERKEEIINIIDEIEKAIRDQILNIGKAKLIE